MKRANVVNKKITAASGSNSSSTKRLYHLRNSSSIKNLNKSVTNNKLSQKPLKIKKSSVGVADQNHDLIKSKTSNESNGLNGTVVAIGKTRRSITRSLTAANSSRGNRISKRTKCTKNSANEHGNVLLRSNSSSINRNSKVNNHIVTNNNNDKNKNFNTNCGDAVDNELPNGDNSRIRTTKSKISDTSNNGGKNGGVGDIVDDKSVKFASKKRINNSNHNKTHETIVEAIIDSASDQLHKSPNNISSSSKSKTKRSRTKRKYLCNFCNKEFLGGNDLRKHIRIHTDERPFECTHCSQRFRQGGCLKNHVASQHGTTQTFSCYYCNKSFPIKERLRLHMRLHSGEKPYQCKICLKRFARGGQLTQHLASHNGIKKYHCTQCSATFSCSMNLKLHLKGHSNERDFTCHMCGKSFIRPDALKKHLTCFHENVKAFYCNICSRTFKGHLPQHMRTHENVKSHGCANCGATFSQKSQLIVHQRIHSGERPYRCQVCWQAFAHSSVLKLHIRKHTGEKPFKCSMCKDMETAFSQLPHLKTHMRAIHGMDKAYNCEFCSEYFKTKHELQEHKIKCPKSTINAENQNGTEYGTAPNFSHDASSSQRSKESSLSRMRLLIAVLLKKISTQDRLKQLGFDKRLIDNVLLDALKMAGQSICSDTRLTEMERLRTNVKHFLDWSVPDSYMKKFKSEQRSTEELLEDLTTTFNRAPTTKT